MASGRLGTSTSLTTNTNAAVYTVPSGSYSVFNVCFCNTQTSSVTIRLAISTSTAIPPTPAASEWIEYDTTVAPKGVFERTGLVADASKVVVCWTSASTAASVGSNVTANVYGIETTIA